jgi:hypothetical protein
MPVHRLTCATFARCPRPRRDTISLPCGRATAHSRGGTRTHGVALGVQQALDDILQHLLLCLSRQTRSGARAPTASALCLGW